MKTLTITYINDAKFDRDINALAELYKYQDTTETKKDFVERKIKEIIQSQSEAYRLLKARQSVVVEE